MPTLVPSTAGIPSFWGTERIRPCHSLAKIGKRWLIFISGSSKLAEAICRLSRRGRLEWGILKAQTREALKMPTTSPVATEATFGQRKKPPVFTGATNSCPVAAFKEAFCIDCSTSPWTDASCQYRSRASLDPSISWLSLPASSSFNSPSRQALKKASRSWCLLFSFHWAISS